MKPTLSTLCSFLACASSLLCLGTAGAQNPLPSRLDQLTGFLGRGTCTGNVLAAKSPHATRATYQGEKALGEDWIVVRYDESATPSNSHPYHVAQYFDYDARAGHFVDVLLDNSGGSYAAGTSSGWQGDAITFENTDFTSGTHPLFRDVFTRRGGLVISHTGYVRDTKGQWMKTDHETCRRI